MAQEFTQYRHPLPKHSYLPADSQSEYCLPPAPWHSPLTLPPMNMSWPSQYNSPPTSWDGHPATHLPSPSPPNTSRSLSPQSVGCFSAGSARSTSQRRSPSASSTSTSWRSPQPRMLTPAPSAAGSPSNSDCISGPTLPRAGSQQFHEQQQYCVPYRASVGIPNPVWPAPVQHSQFQPPYRPTPPSSLTAFTFQSGPMFTPPPFLSTAAFPPVHHFLCLSPYNACHIPSNSRHACETSKWLGLVGRLSRLPREVLLRICGHVDYERLIVLRQLNRFMRDSVDVQVAPYESKVSFVTFAEAMFPQHWPKGASTTTNTTTNGGQDPPGTQPPNGGPQGKRLKKAMGAQKQAKCQKRGKKKTKTGPTEDDDNAEERNGRDARPGNFGCYLECFKVLGPENFESFHWSGGDEGDSPPPESVESRTLGDPRLNQLPSPFSLPTSHLAPDRRLGDTYLPTQSVQKQPTRSLRRYCIKCGVKHGYHRPGEYITRRVGERVWVCQCRRTHNYGVLNCRGCGTYCPFSPNERRSR